MLKRQVRIKEIQYKNIKSLGPLVDEFISTHQSLSFRENYWDSFCSWLAKSLENENVLPFCATIDEKVVGFIIGIIQENGVLLAPERVGYVSIMVVDSNHRRTGIGHALWKELRECFLSKGITYFELYTETGNNLSGPFWKNSGFSPFLERRRQLNESL
jgi:ribosomal protein S18 acetylase RimI-like enzyme